MFPFHVPLGPVAITPTELTILMGVVAAVFVAWPRLKAAGVTAGGTFDLALSALIGGAIGARLFYFIPHAFAGEETWSELLADWSRGSGFYGGVLGGAAGLAVMARLKAVPVLRVFDATAAGMPLAFVFGKIGCFLAGCCYGRRCDGFPGVAFAPGSLAHATQVSQGEIPPSALEALPVHPVQLYEMALALGLFGVLWVVSRRSRRPGETLLVYIAGYSVVRFVVEFFRDDPGRHGLGAGLSDSQVTALVLIAVSGALWPLLRRRPPDPDPDTKGVGG